MKLEPNSQQPNKICLGQMSEQLIILLVDFYNALRNVLFTIIKSSKNSTLMTQNACATILNCPTLSFVKQNGSSTISGFGSYRPGTSGTINTGSMKRIFIFSIEPSVLQIYFNHHFIWQM